MPSGRPVFRNVWLKAWLSVFSGPIFIQSISSPNRPTCYHDNLKWSLLQTFQRWILRGCVHMGRSRLGSVIRGHSDHDTSKKSFNSFPGCIRQFLWRAMIRVTLDYWSWSESPHWNAPLGTLVNQTGNWMTCSFLLIAILEYFSQEACFRQGAFI